MKFAICLLVSYVCLISGYPINEEHSFGTVSRGEIMGTKEVKAEMPMTHRMEYTKYEFTFPEVPTERRITGIKYIDHHPTTRVQFVKGNIGDTQVTLQVVAANHDIHSTFVFYTEN